MVESPTKALKAYLCVILNRHIQLFERIQAVMFNCSSGPFLPSPEQRIQWTRTTTFTCEVHILTISCMQHGGSLTDISHSFLKQLWSLSLAVTILEMLTCQRWQRGKPLASLSATVCPPVSHISCASNYVKLMTLISARAISSKEVTFVTGCVWLPGLSAASSKLMLEERWFLAPLCLLLFPGLQVFT